MRLLLIILACLATCLCLPHTKQRRDILPGDPRYGTEHHHENTIVDVKPINGHYDSIPSVLNGAYGPSGLHPDVPFNDYLPPVIDSFKYSTPLPPYGAHGVVGVPHGLNSIIEPNNIHLQKTVLPTPTPVIVKKTEGIIGTVPATSYGHPIDSSIKTIVKSAAHTHIKTIDSTNAGISTPAVKVIEHAPVVQGLPGLVNGITTLPGISTIGTKNLFGNTLLNGGWPNGQTAYGYPGYGIPGYDVYSQIPTSFYSGLQFPFDTTYNGFGGYGLNHGVYAPESLPLSLQSFPQTLQVPRTTLQVPYLSPHLAQHAEPVHTLESLPPVTSLNTFPSGEAVKSVNAFTPVHPGHPVTSLPPIHPVHPVTSLPPVQTVHSIGSFTTVGPVHSGETLTPVHPIHAVKSLTPVEPVHPADTLTPLHALHSVKSLPPVEPVHSVSTVAPFHDLHSVNGLHSVEPVHSVSTVAPFRDLHSVNGLHSVEPVHSVSTVAPFRDLHSVNGLHSVEPVHSVDTLAPFHALHSVNGLHSVEPVHSVSTVAPFRDLHSVNGLHSVEPVHPVSTVAPFHALHSVNGLHSVEPVHSVSTVAPFHALHAVKSVTPVEPLHPADILPPLHAEHSLKTLTPLSALHPIDNLHPVHSLHTLGAPVHSVGSVTTSHPIETGHAITEVVKTNTLPIIDAHVRTGIQRGPFDDFLQNLGSFFPQLPQLPSLPAFGSVSSTVSPAVEVHSPSSHLLTESINHESVTIGAPVLPTKHLVKKVVTTANEYVQPTHANGGYIY